MNLIFLKIILKKLLHYLVNFLEISIEHIPKVKFFELIVLNPCLLIFLDNSLRLKKLFTDSGR